MKKLNVSTDDAEEPFGYVSQHGIKGVFELQFNRKLSDVYRDTALSITPVYAHPPKPAEPEAETIETLKAENFKLASGQCTEGGPWGDEGGTPYCKYAKLERHNDD